MTSKKRKSTSDQDASGDANDKKHDQDSSEAQSQKPRLTTPDLEFDYDRSQLRDPRPTPGRDARPRYESLDIPQDLKAHIEATRGIPKPEKPIGRLNALQKDQLFVDESRINPLETFHALYRCHDKGRDGSPTYDAAGFQLDWEKVNEWRKPRAYNKQRMVRGMEKRVERAQNEEKAMFDLFFVPNWDDPEGMGCEVLGYVKDQVSKDIGVPWHQIKPEQVQVWRDKGFEPVDFHTWWKEPTEEEKKRMMKMLSGASLRKNL